MEITRGHVEPGALHRAAEAKQRHDDAKAELPVEIGAADPHAVIGENVACAFGLAVTLRPKPHDRKVRRAAADIGDQCDFLRCDLPLVVQRCGDRLELEGDVVEPYPARNRPQRLLSLAIGIRRVVDEMHRTAMDHIAQFAARGLFGSAFDRAEVIGDHLVKSHPLAADAGSLVNQGGAEHRFEAAHQAAGSPLDIGLDRPAADQDGSVDLVENSTRNRGVSALQGHQSRCLVLDGA